MGLFYFHTGTCKSADCSNNCTARRTAKKRQVCEPKLCRTCLFIRKLTLHAILTFICFELAVFSGRNLHARAHGGSQGDAL